MALSPAGTAAADPVDPGAVPGDATAPIAIPALARPLAPSVATPRRLGIVTGATVGALFATLFVFSSPEPDGIVATPVVATGEDGLSSAPADP